MDKIFIRVSYKGLVMRWLLWGYLIVFFWGGTASGEDYHWPMDAKPALTSTFGEYRGGRLHAAIDLKTWGKEGFPVVSVADGYVWRVRTSPFGYGRAVYVHLKDGRFAVWAHLSGFSEAIEKYVQEEQDRRGTYSVNLYFRPDQLPVKRGDVVGFSGSTGIGVPHLHFELRDGDHRPLNPLKYGFDVEDTTPPTITALGFVPLNAQARVNGRLDPQAFTLGWHKKRQQFTLADTITVWGSVGVGVRVYDRADASLLTNKLAPYRMRLLVDNKETFATTLDAFAYGVTQHGELDRNFLMSQRGLGRFHNLYRVAGNYLPFYGAYRIGDGVLHAGGQSTRTGLVLPLGVHEVKVVAEDVAGNVSEARVMVRVLDVPKIKACDVHWLDQAVTVTAHLDKAQRARFAYSKDGGQSWQALGKWMAVTSEIKRTLAREPNALYRLQIVDAFDQVAMATFASPDQDMPKLTWQVDYFPSFAVINVQADRPLTQMLQVQAHYANDRKTLVVTQTGVLTYEVIVPFDGRYSGDVVVGLESDGVTTSVAIEQQTITKRQGGDILSGDGMAMVRFEANGVYETLFGRVIRDSSKTDEHMVGAAYKLMPNDVALDKADVILRYPAGVTDTSKVGIYTWHETKGWVFVDIGRDSGLYAVNGEVKSLGTFALLVDDQPPEVTGLRPYKGQVISDRRPKVLATIRDALSGIWREEDIEMHIDGKKLIVEYDPEEDIVFAKPRKPLALGTHQIEMVVRDICGNETRQKHSFVIE